MNKLKILSLFDGISATQVALKNLGIEYDYYASEIDPYAIKVTQKNFPNTVQLGNVSKVKGHTLAMWENGFYLKNEHTDKIQGNWFPKYEKLLFEYKAFDILIGGSPCQSFSIAGSQKGFEDPRGQLFWEYVRILNEVKPKFFIFENVNSMKQRDKDIISKAFGFEPIVINSALVTAQQRKRLFYVGALQKDGTYRKVEISQPQDKGIVLTSSEDWCYATIGISKNRIFKETMKLSTLTASLYKGVRGAGRPIIAHKSIIGKHIDEVSKDLYRTPTPNECERLQGFPDGFTSGISNTRRYQCLGNSFTVPVIEHILKTIW